MRENMEAEQAVIGAILIDDRCLGKVEFLEPDNFRRLIHRKIFKVMRDGVTTPDEVVKALPARFPQGDVWLAGYLRRLIGEGASILTVRDFAQMIVDGAPESKCHA